MTTIGRDQENALVQAYEVSRALTERTGATESVSAAWDREVAGTVFVYLGRMTPAAWAELRRMTEHTRGRLEATARKDGTA